MASIQGGINQGMGLLNMVLSNKNKGALSVADFKAGQQNVATTATQLSSSMSSFMASGPGSVEISSYPSLGYTRNPMIKLPKYTASTVEHDYLSKSDPAMSEKDYEAAIKKLAEKNAAAGITTDVGNDYFDLARSYVSVVSPDRKAIIAGASPIAMVPTKIDRDMAGAYDDDDNLVATYNPTKGWTNLFTEDEKARNAQFDAIYWDAYNAYTKANNLQTPAEDQKIENSIVGENEGEDKPTTIDVSA